MNNPWREISEWRDGIDPSEVDLWFNVWASPLSMGIADAWRATDCYRSNGKWQDKGGALTERYITHWMPTPPAPLPSAAEIEEAKALIARAETTK